MRIVTYLPVDSIIVLPCVERKPDRVEDDKMRKSIEAGGIQQPLVVCPHGERNYLIDGLTRMRIERVRGVSKVPTMADPCPDDVELERHISRSRFIINFQRQDLLPSQEAECIEYFKRPPFEMTHREIAKLLGWAPDSVTNSLSITHYIKPIAAALDAGVLTRQAARVFDGLTERGQQAIWKKHAEELVSTPGGILHAKLRKDYSPQTHRDFYRQPELIEQRLSRKKGGKRRSQPRPNLDSQEKIAQLSSLKYEEVELKMCKEEIARLDRRRNGTIIPARVILRDETLLEMLSPNMKMELEKWAEFYA